MPTLNEYYNANDDTQSYFYGDAWRAQTFTPSEAHKITSVKLLLFRKGTVGTITVSIRATDGSGHPTGGDFCSGTTDGDTLPTAAPYEWREITLGSGANLSADTKYAIVVSMGAGDFSNRLAWRYDNTDPTYPGGIFEYSANAGVDWTGAETQDFMFEDWGEPAIKAPTVTTQDATNITTTTALGHAEIVDAGGENCNERGIEWGTTPAIYPNSHTQEGSFGAGAFTIQIIELPSGATIYYRGKAHNSIGWGYGQGVIFHTATPPPLITRTLHVRHPALLSVVHRRDGKTIREYHDLSSLDDEYLTGQVGLDVAKGDEIEATTLPGISYRYKV